MIRTIPVREDNGAVREREWAEREARGYKGVNPFFSILPPYCLAADELHLTLLGVGRTLVKGKMYSVNSLPIIYSLSCLRAEVSLLRGPSCIPLISVDPCQCSKCTRTSEEVFSFRQVTR